MIKGKLNETVIMDMIALRNEATWYDFKEFWYEGSDKENTELVRDILCLANAYSENNRYLIFGIRDKPLEIVGLEPDSRYLQDNEIYQILAAKKFSCEKLPIIETYQLYIDNKQLYVIEIKNMPVKPY